MTTAPSPALARLAAVTRRLWLAILLAGVGALVVAVLVGIVVGGTRHGELIPRVMAVAAIAPLFCTLGLIASMVIARGRLAGFMVAGMVLALVTMAGWMAVAWSTLGDDEPRLVTVRLLVTGSLAALWLSVTGALLTAPRRRPRLVVARAVVVGALTLGTAGAAAMLWSVWWQGRMEVPAGAVVLGTLGTVLGFLVVLVLSWRESALARPAGESVPRRLAVRLHCPACDLEQVMETGLAHCRGCHAGLLIDVEEPRCACGYLLYQLVGDSCPECGRSIPAEDRWVGVAVSDQPPAADSGDPEPAADR